jgi:hypothetical protein
MLGLHVNCPLLFSRFSETRILSTDFRKILIPNLMKIRLVGAEFHADGQTDTRKLIVAFRHFRPKNRRNKALPCVIKHYAFEGVWGTAHMAPHMLDSDTWCSENSVSLPGRFFVQRNINCCTLGRGLLGSCAVWTFREKGRICYTCR